MMLAALVNLCAFPLSGGLMPYIARDVFGLDQQGLGWLVASYATGALLGSAVSFNTRGLDFALTALFVVIFIGQWKSQRNHAPALIGVIATAACLLLFGADRFIIPAMALILLILGLFRRRIDGEVF